MSDTELLNRLFNTGNVTILHERNQVFILRSDEEGGKLYGDDDECELSHGNSIREAIYRLPC